MTPASERTWPASGAATQRKSRHTSLDEQATQLSPFPPQAKRALPDRHSPSAQHPEQFAGPHSSGHAASKSDATVTNAHASEREGEALRRKGEGLTGALQRP